MVFTIGSYGIHKFYAKPFFILLILNQLKTETENNY